MERSNSSSCMGYMYEKTSLQVDHGSPKDVHRVCYLAEHKGKLLKGEEGEKAQVQPKLTEWLASRI